MIFTRLALLAIALGLTAACSFSPQKQSPDASVEAAPIVEQTETGTAEQERTEPGAPSVASVNPYLQDRKPVPAVAAKRFDLAVAAMHKEDWPGAQEHLIWLTTEYPQYSGPFLNLGITYEHTGKPVEAEQSLRNAIKANPANVDAYNVLAILLREQGRFTDAEAQYQAALTIWPEHPESHRNLGILYDLYMGRLEDALVHYNDYQRLSNTPDRAIAGWIVDIERRLNQLAMQ